jgi:hypothetical protein
MISVLSLPCRSIAVIPQVRVSALALDDDRGDALVGHLDGVRVAKLRACGAPA